MASPGDQATGKATGGPREATEKAARLDACTLLDVAEAGCGDATVAPVVSQSTRMTVTNGVTENSRQIVLERGGQRHTAMRRGDTQRDACDHATQAACTAAEASADCVALKDYRAVGPETPRRSIFSGPR